MKVKIETVERGQIITKKLSGAGFVSKPAPDHGFMISANGQPGIYVLFGDLSELVHGEIKTPVELDPWRYEDEEASPEPVSPDGGGDAG